MNRTNRYDLLGYILFAIVIFLGVPALLGFDGFELNTFARYLALAMVAMALALSWGIAGVLNLGQALTFALGAYIMAMHLKLKNSTSNPDGMPDFMGWMNVPELPWFWEPFHSLTFTLIGGFAIPAALAGVLGVFMFRGRVTGVFVAIILLALLVAVRLMFIGAQGYTGGFNGITGLARLELFGWSINNYSVQFYYLVAGCLMAALLIGALVARSKVGLVLRAINEDKERVRFFGYDVARYEIVVFSLSAAIAGWSGMLYVLVLEFASPQFMSVAFSLAIVIWVAVGGRESLLGAAIGAILVNLAEGRLSDVFVEGWALILGLMFIFFVLFLPRGLFGLMRSIMAMLSRKQTETSVVVNRRSAQSTTTAASGESAP